jgi:acetyltransferase-like isoleucine patch superfamily enzyme/glycosyltransferase involved in cell wall biosynthesis
MIVRNEESCLATALTSVIGADELVVVDTSLPTDPPDRTREIAESFGAKLFEFPWCDDFSAARNHSLSKCTGDFVLIIDADEELEVGGIDKARAAIAEAGNFKTIGVRCISAKGGDVHWQPRIFKRCSEVHWKGAIHNYLSVVEENRSDITITYGYSEAHKRDPDRALRILSKVLEKNPKSVRETYYLAREHYYRKDWSTAAKWYADYLTRATWAPEMADAWLMSARCMQNLGKNDLAKDACLQAIKINADFQEALEFMASLSGPKNRIRWLAFAKLAGNDSVLFTRGAPAAAPAAKEPSVVYRPHTEQAKGSFSAGAGCEFGEGVKIDCTGDVTVGEHCLFLRGVRIHTHRHDFFKGRVLDVTKEHGIEPTSLRIGSNVVLAEEAVVLADVGEIGDDAIIGTRAVLTHHVGPGEIWAGNPARKIGHRDDVGAKPHARVKRK